MRSAVFYGKKKIRVEDLTKPEIGPEEVLIKVMACGVCGTDVHIFEGAEGAAPTIPPMILGHEFSGIVARVGEKAGNFAVGDRACVDPNVICGKCSFCLCGKSHFCENMKGIGTTVNGGFAEYCAVPYQNAYKLADHISFEEGAMVEPIACCLHGIEQCELHAGSTVMIIGAGTIGLIMLQLARLSGASHVLVIEPVKEKREKALQLGADLALNPAEENISGRLKTAGNQGFDAVIECVGLPTTMKDAVRYAGKKSVVLLFGLTTSAEEITIRPFELFKNEISIKTSFINPYTHSSAIALLNANKINVKSLLSESVSLEELSTVLEDPARRRSGKVIVLPHGV